MKLSWVFALFVAVPVLASATDLSTPSKPQPLWSDLNDMIQYAPKTMPDAPAIALAIKKDPRFVSGGAKFASGLQFEYQPAPAATNGINTYRGVAQMTDDTGRYFYRKFVIDVDSARKSVTGVTIAQDLNLSDMHFTVSAGLLDRMVVVEDVADDVLLAFPLGVGGLDENVMGLGRRILTPLFHGAHLDRAHVIKKRYDPTYYRGEPFMPITNARGGLTPIAFHVTILDDDVWSDPHFGPNYLMRGFESHGCMRLRLKDLTEFFNIVENSADRQIPVDVEFYIYNRGPDGKRDPSLGPVSETHPYPLENNSYMGIENFALPGEPPQYQRDDTPEHLIIMERVNHAPNLKGLQGSSADTLMDMSVFDGLTIDLKKLH